MIAWLSCASGVSGDMLLGALVGAGVPVEVMAAAVDAVAPAPVELSVRRVERSSLVATKVDVLGTESTTHRTWADVRSLLEPADVLGRDEALATFAALARAEGAVHGCPPDDVHFHEVGALDAIADVVGVCAGFAHLRQVHGLGEVVVSPVALGGGHVRAAHGFLPVPGPAVVDLLSGRPTVGGPVDVELATPTGAALLRTLATAWGYQPLMSVEEHGTGAGGRDLPDRPNVLRLLLGTPWSSARSAPAPVPEHHHAPAPVPSPSPAAVP